MGVEDVAASLAGAAGLLAFFGVLLEVSFVLHVLAGTASFPFEAMDEVNLPVVAALTTLVCGSVLCAGLFASRRSDTATAVGAVAVLAALFALRSPEQVAHVPSVVVATLALALALALAAGSRRPTAGKKQRGSLVPVFAAVALLAFLFKSTQPEAQCFAKLQDTSVLRVVDSASISFGPASAYTLSLDATLHEVRLVHRSTSGKYTTLFASSPGKAFLVGAMQGSFDAPNEHEMGLYEFADLASNFSVVQTVDKVELLEEGAAQVQGALEFEGGFATRFSLVFHGAKEDHVSFRARTEAKMARLYIAQRSARDEGVFGMGIQYSFMNLKGGCVPVFTQEQGIGRGLQPVTFLVNFFVKHASGSWQTSYAPAPYYLTSAMRAMYLTSNNFSLFDFSSATEIVVEVNASDVSGGLIAGEAPLEVIETYTREHAGRMRPLPDWTGNGAIVGLQGGTAKVRAHVDKLKAAGVPLAALWLQDWTGKRETDFGRRLQWNWELSDKHYPGWLDFVRELAKEQIYVLSYINAYLANTGGRSGESTSLFQEATKLDCLVKESDGKTVQIQASATPDFTYGTVDITDPRCQKWYIDKVIIERMFGKDTTSFEAVNGVMGFMADFAESVSMGARFHAGEGSTLHNDFPVLWAETCRKAIDKHPFTKENAVFFMRAAGAQTPGHSTLMWMGDQMTTFDHYDGMRSALTGVLAAGISGFSLAHSDIGGYTMLYRFGGLIKIVRSPELFMRWAEMNVFSDSVFRTHEGVLPDQSAQAVDDSVIAHFAKFATLHQRLWPLKKALMQDAAASGAPLARHLFLHYPHDPVARRAPDQFMLGDSLLVCPIVSPGDTERSCYVPEGEWAHVFTGEKPTPRSFFTCPAPLGQPCVLHLPQAAEAAAIIRKTLA